MSPLEAHLSVGPLGHAYARVQSVLDKVSVRAAGALAAGSLAAEAEEASALLAAMRPAQHATETR